MTTSGYEIRREIDEDRTVFRLIGDLGAESAPMVRTAIDPHLTGGRPITVDCAVLRVIAPEVLSTLVACARLARVFDTPFELQHLSVALRDAVGGPLANHALPSPP